MLFAFYLIRKPPVFQKIMKMLTWFISSNSRKDYHDVNKSENGQKAIATSSLSSHGYLKILFYFYQVAGLLTVPSYGAGELLTDKTVFPITSLFDFQLYLHIFIAMEYLPFCRSHAADQNTDSSVCRHGNLLGNTVLLPSAQRA